MAVANNNRANYWQPSIPSNYNENAFENSGTKSAFSTVPQITAPGKLYVFENCVKFEHPAQSKRHPEPPEHDENYINSFSKKSRKRLFNIFNCLQYSEYGIPLFITLTFHFDAPEDRKNLKKILENFFKRLKRILPEFHYIWKLEYQERGTPHFHIILFPLDKKMQMYSPARELQIHQAWFQLKQCKCTHCAKFSTKIVSVNSYKIAVSYISKEIAKIQDRYEDHDLGRIWGLSHNMKLNHIFSAPCKISDYEKIIDKKLEEDFIDENQKLYVNGIRFLAQNSSIFINHEKIKNIYLKLETENILNLPSYRKFKLKRNF